MKVHRHWLAALFVFSLPAFAASQIQGIHNFHQVDDHVYRGGQPTDEGFKYLAKIGVKTVLNLREADQRSLEEERVVTSLGMHYVNVPMTGLTPPTDAQMAKILALLADGTTGGVFVHCKRGADRTGAVIGAYRIEQDHWDNAQALREAMADGMSFFQIPRQRYIRTFQARTLTATAAANSNAAETGAPPVAAAGVPAVP